MKKKKISMFYFMECLWQILDGIKKRKKNLLHEKTQEKKFTAQRNKRTALLKIGLFTIYSNSEYKFLKKEA